MSEQISEQMAESDAAANDGRAAGFARVEFRGDAGEYFGIWIVNLMLSIVTLGVYSAWAKVRTNRYFYGHTLVQGEPLRYLANPLQILIGRAIGVVLLGAYLAAAYASPALFLIVALAMLVITPQLICMGLRFKMRMSAWRNVRFNFRGDYGGAFKTYVLFPLIGVFTLNLAFPWVLKKMDEFKYKNYSYGDQHFESDLNPVAYYVGAIVGVLFGLLWFFGAMWLFGIGGLPTVEEDSFSFEASGLLEIISLIVTSVVVSSVFQTVVRNHLYGRTHIPGLAKFKSDVDVVKLIALQISNLFALVLTVGFALPWVRIRTARFFAEATAVHVDESINEVIAQMPENVTAFGDEVSTLFDFDVGVT